MDPRVLEHFGGDISRANIQPNRRAEVLTRYGAPPAAAVQAGAGPQLADQAAGTTCPGCGYTYDEASGAPREGFPAGTPWSAVPDTWPCLDCGVREKRDFVTTAPVAR